ncbi:Os04g0181500 [Oryza sativa Japonica Group]|uniref:Os04g0181500 protein n=1 Tax=Oryza sativa subsp. japonica TaxID=39947 RepID=A0A0P0W713_ORYSJ|nr:Os04g0181500 [Oryza sativa Japonica Group]
MLPIASVKTKVTTTEGHQSGGMVAAVLKDMGIQAWSPSGSRENEAKSSGAGSTTHHCHSSSVDSFMMGNLNFGARQMVVKASPLPNVKFTEDDKKKVVADKFLSEIVLTDPRRDPEQSIICRKVKGEKDEVYRGASTQILGVAVGDCYIMSTSGNDAEEQQWTCISEQ